MSQTLFDKIGGEAAMTAAVDIFYRKVLADDRISDFFDDTDMLSQHSKQQAFLTYVCGGPGQYSGQDMRNAHAHLVADKGLSDVHFNAVAEHLEASLQELGLAAPLVADVIAIAESARADVLGR